MQQDDGEHAVMFLGLWASGQYAAIFAFKKNGNETNVVGAEAGKLLIGPRMYFARA
jgi:hypothetical protein